jgi:uncharacterized repeat protein (TIGR03803 family)
MLGSWLAICSAVMLTPPSPALAQTVYQTIYSFTGTPDGAAPNGALTVDKNGVLYGTTYSGGANGLGCIFSLTPVAGGAWQEAVLYSFSGPDGAYPLSTLTPGHSGEFYGTTSSGGGGAGTVFELSPPTVPGGAWTEQVLYSFSSSSRNPQNVSPNGNVILDSNGSLYVTMQGSPTRSGTALGLVIALTPPNSGSGSWIEHELFGFGPDVGWAGGAMPLAGVVSLNGSLFGTTYTEGDSSCGTTGCGAVYQLTPPAQAGAEWTETTLHTFSGYPADGAESYAPLTVGPGGVLFGTTFYGGAYSQTCQANGVDVGCGAVFELTPPTSPGGSWTESIIYSFAGEFFIVDGAEPVGPVVVGNQGVLYGTTKYGGLSLYACPATDTTSQGCGGIFQLTPPNAQSDTWTETLLHSFSGQSGDGALPNATLAPGPGGVLYGTTSKGGAGGKGTVFSVQP